MIIKSRGGGNRTLPPEAAPGPYPMKMIRFQERKSRDGNDYLMCIHQILDGSFTNAEGESVDAAGMEIIDNMSLQDNAEWKIAQFYEAVLGEPYPADGEQWDFNSLQGPEFNATVVADSYEGKTRASIDEYLKP